MSQFSSLPTSPMYWGQTITIDGADIRNLASPIGFSGQAWQTDVHKTLRKIEQSQTGEAFMRLMNIPTEIKGHCRIIPIDANAPSRTSALPTNWESSLRKGTSFNCDTEMVCAGSRPAGAPNRVVGRGTGSDVLVKFHPDSWRFHDRRQGMDDAQDKFRADDILLHELVHAYQAMRGALSIAHAPEESNMHYDEEFYAITIANMYVSETGRREALRADHDAVHRELTEFQSYEPHFYDTNKVLIERMCEVFPESFIFTLSNLTAPTFNPFRYRREKLENPTEPNLDMYAPSPHLELSR